MNIELMNLFVEYMEKQKILSRLTENQKLYGYSYSEIHTITAIAKLEAPNVTGLAESMHLTRGAVSKIAKKLQGEDLIETYMLPGNRQKVYFRLTSKGRFLYDEHEKRHQRWLQRDDEFLQKYEEADLERIRIFMKELNEYLQEQIIELGEHGYEN